jgi:hypothetical protein
VESLHELCGISDEAAESNSTKNWEFVMKFLAIPHASWSNHIIVYI